MHVLRYVAAGGRRATVSRPFHGTGQRVRAPGHSTGARHFGVNDRRPRGASSCLQFQRPTAPEHRERSVPGSAASISFHPHWPSCHSLRASIRRRTWTLPQFRSSRPRSSPFPGLAVDDASRELLSRAGGLASCYQSLLVAIRLSRGDQPERFHLIAQNFSTGSDAIASTGRWSPLAIRLTGLAELSQAVDLLLTGRDLEGSRRLLGAAGRDLDHARSMLSTTPELGYMIGAVDQELAAARTVGSMLNIAESSGSVPPHPLAFIQRLTGIFDWLSQNGPSEWAPSFRSARLREETFRRAAEVRAAQSGRGSVKVILAGPGTLVPFWVVELPYTFETGVLWTKHGKEVPEILLVAATFPTDISSMGGAGTANVLTDIFAISPGARALGKYADHLRGREQRISDSGGLIPLLQNATMSTIEGQQAIPPLTTEIALSGQCRSRDRPGRE